MSKQFDLRDLTNKNPNAWTTIRILPEDAIATQFYATHGTDTTRFKKLKNGDVIEMDKMSNAMITLMKEVIEDTGNTTKETYQLSITPEDEDIAGERLGNIVSMMRVWGEYVKGESDEENLFKYVMPDNTQLSLLVAYDIVVFGYKDVIWTLESPANWGEASDIVQSVSTVNWNPDEMFIEFMEFVQDYPDESDCED